MFFFKRIFNIILSVLALNVMRAESLTGTSVILGRKHYYIETEGTKNFFDAAHACAQYDMTLASIENQEEYNSLFAIVAKTGNINKPYWLSARPFGTTSSTYYWLGTGKAVSYWPKNSPLTPETDKYIATKADTFEYENVAYTTPNYYICEKPLEPNCGKLGQCRYTYSSNSV